MSTRKLYFIIMTNARFSNFFLFLFILLLSIRLEFDIFDDLSFRFPREEAVAEKV